MAKPPQNLLLVPRPWVKNRKLPRAMRSPVPLDRKNSWIGNEIFRFHRDLVAQLGRGRPVPTQVATIELASQIPTRPHISPLLTRCFLRRPSATVMPVKSMTTQQLPAEGRPQEEAAGAGHHRMLIEQGLARLRGTPTCGGSTRPQHG